MCIRDRPNLLAGGQKSPFQLVKPVTNSSNGSAFQHINSSPNYTPKSSTSSPFHQLRPMKPPSPFQQHQLQQPQVKVLLGNGNSPSTGSSYKSTIENKVKLLSQNPNQTYASSMHIRVPSQESSIYSDTRTYINVGQPVAIASRAGGILMNPSQLNKGIQQSNKAPAIPRSQLVKKVMEPSYSSLLQNQGEQNQAIYANFDFRSSDGSNTEEEIAYTSPPSPVSSSYSELRAAARGPLGAAFHQQMNPQAMIYDPLYEPISGQSTVSNHQKPNFGLGGLSSHYGDSFGPCSKCLELIVGEGTGCSAMGRLYHIKCFTCHNCGCQLQGKPFYALDGKVS